ncbi:MAG: cupin domain-containing protein [Halioglobus sp.]
MPPWSLNLDRKDFMANYWQRKPLLIPGAIQQFASPIDANELAGLALEEEVESRIIEFRNDNWHAHNGPFTTQSFDRKHPWTLLVQGVDQLVDEVAQLLKLVDFIPQWRLDDVMISYAVDGASVGPHYDNYDVFLLQAQGLRQWHLGQQCNEHTPLKTGTDLRILENFQCQSTHLLSPGDILYVPPGVAHWGVASGESMTYSVGFRAPRMSDILSRGVDAALETLSAEAFYSDPGLASTHRPGEISSEDNRRAKDQLIAALSKFEDTQWFGELVTEPKHPFEPIFESEAFSLADLRDDDAILGLCAHSKIAWQQSAEDIVVFANGESKVFGHAVLPTLIVLCGEWLMEGSALSIAVEDTETATLLVYLLELGCLEFK